MLARSIAIVACVITCSAAAQAAAPIATLPIVFHVATDEGEPVRDADWIAAQLARANEIFAPEALRFESAGAAPMPARYAHVLSRADRDAFAPLVRKGAVNVFVVAALADVDEERRYRSGVHWRASDRAGVRYVILSAWAPSGVLAHELGHFFGNPHSHVPDNVMSYTRTGKTPFFDARQGEIMRAEARRVLESRELVPLTPAAPN